MTMPLQAVICPAHYALPPYASLRSSVPLCPSQILAKPLRPLWISQSSRIWVDQVRGGSNVR